MPRVTELQLVIETGDVPLEQPVILVFNNHPIPVPADSGGTGAGETFEGRFRPNSFAHSVALQGPEAGEWAVNGVTVTYRSGADEWTVRWGAVTLTAETAVDIWEDPPLPSWDV